MAEKNPGEVAPWMADRGGRASQGSDVVEEVWRKLLFLSYLLFLFLFLFFFFFSFSFLFFFCTPQMLTCHLDASSFLDKGKGV
jgi:hypothetical protein